MASILGEAKFFEESVNAEKLKKLLDGKSHTGITGQAERIQAMKWLMAMISKGRDVSQFYPDVVKNVVSKAVELKKLSYMYLMHYADHDATCRELALLSINSFQQAPPAPAKCTHIDINEDRFLDGGARGGPQGSTLAYPHAMDSS